MYFLIQSGFSVVFTVRFEPWINSFWTFSFLLHPKPRTLITLLSTVAARIKQICVRSHDKGLSRWSVSGCLETELHLYSVWLLRMWNLETLMMLNIWHEKIMQDVGLHGKWNNINNYCNKMFISRLYLPPDLDPHHHLTASSLTHTTSLLQVMWPSVQSF